MHVFVLLVVSICQAKLNFHDTLSLFHTMYTFFFMITKGITKKTFSQHQRSYTCHIPLQYRMISIELNTD